MSIIVPEYYHQFRCSPKECKKNCCIGWEIDIDTETAEKYLSDSGVLKDKFQKCIKYENDSYQFILNKDERCPFLNSENLCEIILNYGESSLCEICDQHPRFRNFIGTIEEIGLGITCEIAGNIIIHNESPFRLVDLKIEQDELDDYERNFLNFRDDIFKIATNRTIPLEKRFKEIAEKIQISCYINEFEYWKNLFLDLEILNNEWINILNKPNIGINFSDVNFLEHETEYENLFTYFVFRQFTPAIDDEFIKERLIFCMLSVYIIRICSEFSGENIVEISAIFSSEIEYSDENVYRLLDEINERLKG